MLRILSDKKKNYFYNQMIGKNLDVLFESCDEDNNMKGFSSNYVRFQNKYNEKLENQICVVEAKDIVNGLAFGKIKEIKNSVVLELS